MQNMFLTDAERNAFIGLEKPKLQIDWLRKHGIPHMVNHKGEPVVLKAYVCKLLGYDEAVKAKRAGPNEKALLKHLGANNGAQKTKNP